VNDALALPSPVNIGLSSLFDAGTRELSVNVELYYTADGTGGNDYISVFLKESHIIGYQQDYINGAQANYDHKDVMRGYITALWGDEVATNTAGTTVLRTYTFSVPVDWNEANCKVVAFVGEYQGEIYQAREVDAVGGSTSGISDPTADAFGNAYPMPANDVVRIPFNGGGGPVTLQVTDATGRVVSSVQNAADATGVTVKVAGLPNGLYTYRVTSTNGLHAGRMIVEH
jgi:hypothetical protein